eukprot:5886616-Pyramimonas_sp.AAC.1
MPVGIAESVRASMRRQCACPNLKCARRLASTFKIVWALRYKMTTGQGVPRRNTRPCPPCSAAGVKVSVR